VLFALFLCRVVAQPLALVVHSAVLPPFEAWHSGAIPYSLLLASQLLILAASGWMAWRFSIGAVEPRRPIGLAAIAVGGLYFLGMVARLVLGATVLSDARWFAPRPDGVPPGARGLFAARRPLSLCSWRACPEPINPTWQQAGPAGYRFCTIRRS